MLNWKNTPEAQALPWFQVATELGQQGIPTTAKSFDGTPSLIVPAEAYDTAQTIAAGRYPIVGNPDWAGFQRQLRNEQQGYNIWERPETKLAVALAGSAAVAGGAFFAAAPAVAGTAATGAAAGTTTGTTAVGSLATKLATVLSAGAGLFSAFKKKPPTPSSPLVLNLPTNQEATPVNAPYGSLASELGLSPAGNRGTTLRLDAPAEADNGGSMGWWLLLAAAAAWYLSRR